MDLGETNEFFDTDEALVERANSFIAEKCGRALFTDDDRRGTFIPDELSDEDFMRFLAITGLSAYKLTKFEEEPRFYAIWLPEEEGYLTIDDESSVALVYGDSIPDLKREVGDELEYRFDGELVRSGELEALSDNPAILNEFLAASRFANYDATAKQLKIDTTDVDTLFSVNELLKPPLLDIRQLTVEEVMAIETELEEECY